MNTIIKAETREMEQNLALSWYEGIYTQSQAEWSAEQQSLTFENVANEYARLYEEDQRNSASDCMLSNILNIEARYHYGNN